MKAAFTQGTVRHEQGFAVYELRNSQAAVAIVPELGAKIISLRDLQTGREWLWHPGASLKLFRNQPDDAFEQSPLVGVDECLPTVAPCQWRNRSLPDHGEVWSVPWTVDEAAWEQGILRTSVTLPVSPLTFERTIELLDGEIRLGYRLQNCGAEEETFLWAWHPLLRMQPGDEVRLPDSIKASLRGEEWDAALKLALPEGGCAKLFAGPLTEGLVGVYNDRTGDALEFTWDAAENDTLGLWVTRGGWHGHHHLALEPTNGAADTLLEAEARGQGAKVGPGEVKAWQLRVRVGRG